MKLQHRRPIDRTIIVSFSLLLLGVGGIAAWWTSRTQSPPLSHIPSPVKNGDKNQIPAPPVSLAPSAPPASERAISALRNSERIAKPVEIYWLEARNNEIHLVPVPFVRDPREPDTTVLTNSLHYLLENPGQSSLTSTIPAGTRLLGLRVRPNGIYVNLSHEFQQGGGSASMIHRVAQVLYTVTSLQPDANVYLSVEGKLLDEDNPLGGEGVILPVPLTREKFAKEFSLIAQSDNHSR
jgi:spore germination protein GerM